MNESVDDTSSSGDHAFPRPLGGDWPSAARMACIGGLVASGVAATALALAAVTEARHETPSLAEAREVTLAEGREALLRRDTSSHDGQTPDVRIPATQTGPPLTDD